MSVICKRNFILVLLLFIGMIPYSTSATSSDNFDSYSTGYIENVTNGVWNSSVINKVEIFSSPAFSSPNSLGCDKNVCATATTSASDLVSYSRYLHTGYIYNEGRNHNLRLYDTNGVQMVKVSFPANGNFLTAENNSYSENTSNGYATSTWIYYQIDIDFDNDQFRANIDDGSFTGWIPFNTSTGTPERWQINTASAVAGTMFAWDDFGTDSSSNFVNLPSDENYIVIFNPVKETGYSTEIIGELNIPATTSATSTYVINFLSTTGIDYDDIRIVATTTDQEQFRFEHNITFSQDDIIYARAYLYDSDNQNAVNLVDISPSYEWWISANANSLETVDLGTFSFGSTSPCASNFGTSSITNFGYAFCEGTRFLFFPSESSIDFTMNKINTLASTSPFSYIYDVKTYTRDLFSPSTSTFEVSLPTTTPYFGGFIILDTSMVEAMPLYDQIYTFLGYFFYLSLIFYVFARIKGVFIGSSENLKDKNMSI